MRALILTLLVASNLAFSIGAQDDPSSSASKVRMYVVTDRAAVEPGGQVRLAVILDHEAYWHTYAHDSAAAIEQSMITTAVTASTSSPSITVHSDHMVWPEPHQVEMSLGGPPITFDVYEGRAIIYIPITVAGDAEPGAATVSVTTKVQTCDDSTCLAPADLQGSVDFSIVPAGQEGPRANEEIFSGFPESAWDALPVSSAPAQVRTDLDVTLIIVIVAAVAAGLIVLYLWNRFAR